MSTDTSDTSTASAVSPVAWFEIGTEDPEAARSFYGELFGWTFNVDGPYSEISYGTGQPPQGGIQDTSTPLPDGTPRSYAIPYVLVQDVEATCAEVEEHGGKVMVPATTVPNGLVYAHVRDPFGNHFGLFKLPA
jgi:predicted enzyme related to lactoylglutathione lyase